MSFGESIRFYIDGERNWIDRRFALSIKGYGGIMVWTIIGAGVALIILWLIVEIINAPNGYEDENDFHEVEDGKECPEIEKLAGETLIKIRRRVVAKKQKPRLNSM